eukprot:PITA_16134
MENSMSRARAASLNFQKWISFVAAIWIMAISGTNFDFSIYSSDLKKVLNINQIKLNNLAEASDLGKLLGWVAGLACTVLPTWAVLGIAGLLGFIGYGVQWLVVSGIIQPLPYLVMYMLCFIAGNSICWFNTVCFKVAISNFPSCRGIAAGLSTSYSGLSTVIYTNLSSVIDPANRSLYLLLNALVPLVLCAIGAIFINIPQPNSVVRDQDEKKYMYIFTFTALVTALYSVVYGFLPHGLRSRELLYMGVLTVLLLSILYVPLKAVLSRKKMERNASSRVIDLDMASRVKVQGGFSITDHSSWKQYIEEINNVDFNNHEHVEKPRRIEDIEADNMENGIQQPAASDITAADKSFWKPVPPVGEEHGVLQLVRSINFWLYYIVYLCGGTLALVYINNMGQIVQSLRYSKTQLQLLVALVSAFGFLGRIASGLPDYFKRMNGGLPRPAWLGIWMTLMLPTFFLMAVWGETQWVLYLCTAIIGTSAGAITSVAVPTSSELFGMERFGVNHNLLISNIAFGSLLFGDMAGLVYDRSEKSNPGAGHDLCVGMDCYAKTFLAWGGVCAFGLFLNVILCLRTRKFYKSLYLKHTST